MEIAIGFELRRTQPLNLGVGFVIGIFLNSIKIEVPQCFYFGTAHSYLIYDYSKHH